MHDTVQQARNFGPNAETRVFQQPQPIADIDAKLLAIYQYVTVENYNFLTDG